MRACSSAEKYRPVKMVGATNKVVLAVFLVNNLHAALQKFRPNINYSESNCISSSLSIYCSEEKLLQLDVELFFFKVDLLDAEFLLDVHHVQVIFDESSDDFSGEMWLLFVFFFDDEFLRHLVELEVVFSELLEQQLAWFVGLRL